jgi:hypothetical protein
MQRNAACFLHLLLAFEESGLIKETYVPAANFAISRRDRSSD